MDFIKYHGLGNDFVVIDVADPAALSAAQAQKICDRHFGVGADGVLLVSPAEGAAARMTVINADGSQPEMCGNGLRCVALHLLQQHGAREQFEVATDAGTLHCGLQLREGQHWIEISLGQARILEPLNVELDAAQTRFDRVSMGNPHAVTFGSLPSTAAIDRFGPHVSSLIAGGANIEFVERVGPAEFRVIVWERGVGRTLACGTGAGAVAVAAVQSQRAPFGEQILVHLPGGPLELVVSADLEVRLRGPATRVFSGTLDAS